MMETQMKKILVSAALAMAVASPAIAEKKRELSAPIVAFTPVIKKNADALELNESQRADLAAWLAEMPAKRKALEAEALGARAELRMAIIEGAPNDERAALAERVGDIEAKLVTMRSNCTDHWREVLSEEQFDQMLKLAAAE